MTHHVHWFNLRNAPALIIGYFKHISDFRADHAMISSSNDIGIKMKTYSKSIRTFMSSCEYGIRSRNLKMSADSRIFGHSLAVSIKVSGDLSFVASDFGFTA